MQVVGAVLLLVAALVAVGLGEPTGWRPAAGPQRQKQELLSGRPFKVELEGKGIDLDIVWWPPASGLDFSHALLVSVVTSTSTPSSSSIETTTSKTLYVPPPRVLERDGRLLPNWRNWPWLQLADLIPAGRGHNFTIDVSIVDETSSANNNSNNQTIVRRVWGVASDRLGATYLQLRVNNNTVTTDNEGGSVKHDLAPVYLDLVINDVTYGCRCWWRAVTSANAHGNQSATATAQLFNSELRPVKDGGPHDWECVPSAAGTPVIPAGVEYHMWVYYANQLLLPVVDDALKPTRPIYAVVTTGAVAVSWTMTPTPQGDHVACPGTELAFRGAFVPDRRYRCMVFVSTPESSPRAHVLASTEELPDAQSASRVVCTLPPAIGFGEADNGRLDAQRATIVGVFLSEVQSSRMVYGAVNLTVPFLTSCTDNGNGSNGGGSGNGGNSEGGGSDQGGNDGGGGAGDGGDGQGNVPASFWEDVTQRVWMFTCAGAALLVAFGLCTGALTFRTHARSSQPLAMATTV